MAKRIVPQYESDLFEWAEKQAAPQWPRNSYNTVDVSNEEFDYEMYKRRIAWQDEQRTLAAGVPIEPPPPPKPVFTSLMEYLDDFMPGALEQADLMHKTWGPVQEDDAVVKFLYAKVSSSVRREREYKAGGTFTTDDIIDLFELQDGRCCYCGMPFHSKEDFEVDHMLPIAKGGDNSPENIALACFNCNRSKRDHLLEDWFALRGWY